jgi:hypothetical protein
MLDLNGTEGSIVAEQPLRVEDEARFDRPKWIRSLPKWLRGLLNAVWWWSPEAKIEASRLAFALAIAVAGVYTLARDKVGTMDLLPAVGALIALGFGVDIVKTVLTQNAGTGAPK